MSLKNIVSQHRAICILKGTLKRNKIPGAFLFIGEPFIGKTTTAIEYAKALTCYNLKDYDSCDECISCKKIQKGTHPDVKLFFSEKDTITVEVIREIEEFLAFHSLESEYRVVILKNAEKMNKAAANAFLKTLEEPPDNTVLILTCENTDALPEPLLSRTFKIYFTPLSKEAMEKFFSFENKKEDLIKLAMGRPGSFLSIDLIKKIETFKESLNFNKFKKSPWKDNEELKWWIDIFLILLRDKICEKILKENCHEYLGLNFEFCQKLSLDDLFIIYEKLQGIRRNIELNLNKAIIWNYITNLLRGEFNG